MGTIDLNMGLIKLNHTDDLKPSNEERCNVFNDRHKDWVYAYWNEENQVFLVWEKGIPLRVEGKYWVKEFSEPPFRDTVIKSVIGYGEDGGGLSNPLGIV